MSTTPDPKESAYCADVNDSFGIRWITSDNLESQKFLFRVCSNQATNNFHIRACTMFGRRYGLNLSLKGYSVGSLEELSSHTCGG